MTWDWKPGSRPGAWVATKKAKVRDVAISVTSVGGGAWWEWGAGTRDGVTIHGSALLYDDAESVAEHAGDLIVADWGGEA